MMDQNEIKKLITEMQMPENLRRGTENAVEKLRGNLDAIDKAMPILFRCIIRFNNTLAAMLPEGEINDTVWEDFISGASNEWKTYIEKFDKTPLNGCCQDLLRLCLDSNIDELKRREAQQKADENCSL